ESFMDIQASGNEELDAGRLSVFIRERAWSRCERGQFVVRGDLHTSFFGNRAKVVAVTGGSGWNGGLPSVQFCGIQILGVCPQEAVAALLLSGSDFLAFSSSI